MVLRVSEDGAQGQQEKDRRVFNGEITVTHTFKMSLPVAFGKHVCSCA